MLPAKPLPQRGCPRPPELSLLPGAVTHLLPNNGLDSPFEVRVLQHMAPVHQEGGYTPKAEPLLHTTEAELVHGDGPV